jgi:hypothetical protein
MSFTKIFSNKQKNKKNVLLLASNQADETFMSKLYDFAEEQLSNKLNVFFRRVTNFFIIEWIFAIQNNLDADLVNYIAEYSFRKHILKKKQNIFTRFYFNCLAKMHFINSYTYLRKHNIDLICVKDDTTIANLACIVAGHNLKIDVKILYEGYREEMLFVDDNATRFRNSLPRNVEFYKNLEIEPHNVEVASENVILILLQPDDSVEILLDSPFVKNQKYILNIISVLAKNYLNYKFVIFGCDEEFHNTENVIFSSEDFVEFLPIAKAVLTVNSIKAMYAFEYNKPVVLLGNAFYNFEGLTITVKNEQEFFGIVEMIEKFAQDDVFDGELAHKFVAFVQHYYAFRCVNMVEPSEDDARNILAMIDVVN